MIEQTSKDWQQITDGTDTLLGIALGKADKSLNLRSVHQPGSRGWVWAGDSVTPWIPRGLMERQGSLYLTGPGMTGRSLLEILDAGALTPDHLGMLARGLTALEKHFGMNGDEKDLHTRISALGTFFTDDGRILFLSDGITSRLLPLVPRGTNPWEDRLKYPKGDGRLSPVFGWSVLAYFYYTGSLPFASADEELRNRIVKGVFVPMEAFRPELNPELISLVHRGLSPGKDGSIALSGLTAALPLPENTGSASALSMEETELRKSRAEKTGRRRERSFGRQTFFRKKGTLVAAAAVGLIIIGSIAGTILSGVFAPPLTRGMEPREVLESFFGAINSLDTETVSGCADRRAAKERIGRITNLYAISRIRLAYEGDSPFVPAPDWLAREEKTLGEQEVLYGISGLKLTSLAENRFLAEYTEWSTEVRESSPQKPEVLIRIIHGVNIKEEYTLTRKRDAWKISLITPVSREEFIYGKS